MTFCGYAPEMKEGLIVFGNGVASSTIKKAKNAKRSIKEHVSIELSQLDVLIRELQNKENNEKDKTKLDKILVLKNLAILCKICFENSKGILNDEDFKKSFSNQFEKFGDLIKTLEDNYERCPNGTSIIDRTKTGIDSVLLV